MKKTLACALILWVPFVSISQNNNDQSKTLFTLGDTPYSVDEFEYYFLKNSEKPSAQEAKKMVTDYLDLYVEFRLKVLEAKKRGLDQDEAFITELEGYKDQLIEPYLVSSKINEGQLMEAYNRMKTEVAGSHILITPPPNATPEDTLRVYEQLVDLKRRAENGEDFGELAVKFSQDRSAQMNKGYLGYFTALQMVYPFENAAYNAEVGEIVGPFKTRFGYHILKLTDKRPARGQVLAAHIMIRHEQDSVTKAKAEQKIQSIAKRLEEGGDWDELCEVHSEDKHTNTKGGKLNWMFTGDRLPGEFKDAAFALENAGDISEPVMTRFGWHIIKLLDKKSLGSFEEERLEIEKKIGKDSRSSLKRKSALKALKEKNGYQLNTENKNSALAEIDSTLLKGTWKYDSTSILLSKELFSLSDTTFSVADFWTYVTTKQKRRSKTSLTDYVSYLYNEFEEISIFDYEKSQVMENNLEFQQVMDEYESGILLFNLMEKEVWNKAMEDTVGLRAYYDKNSSNYQEEEHALVMKYSLSDSTLLESLLVSLGDSALNVDSLFNSKEPLTLESSEDKIKKGDNEFLDGQWTVGQHIEKKNNRVIIWSVEKINPKRTQELNEVKGLVISDYQADLEKNWIKSLKKKYPLKVNKKVLKSYIAQFE